MSNHYTLEVISHHPKFRNQKLRKYYVDGIETVGAWGDEPFEIVFKNHSWQKVQVKLSVDGTDILTGDVATTEPTKDMWVVSGYGTLSLKAWPETNNGGAQLVFTSANNSVAIHTHGNLSSRGIIAAAVYTEGHVEPIRLNSPIIINNPVYPCPTYPTWIGGGYYSNTGGSFGSGITYGGTSGGGILRANTTTTSVSNAIPTTDCYYNASVSDSVKSLESLAAVGAGQHVDQKITYTTGLIKPELSETVRVKYMWWDDLVSKLRENNVPSPHASGFPGDRKQHIMSIGNTPRIGSFTRPAFPREQVFEPVYSRI